VGPRPSLDAVTKRKYTRSYQESNSGRPARSLVTVLTELPCSIISLPYTTLCYLKYPSAANYRTHAPSLFITFIQSLVSLYCGITGLGVRQNGLTAMEPGISGSFINKTSGFL
jgi:hypothetical protein